MRKWGAFILLLVGMAGGKCPPAEPAGPKKKKGKKAATSTKKVAVPDVIPVVDTFNSSAENSENFENSTQSVRDWSGDAMQQQAWGWLASNLTAIMNQLKGNVRNDSAKGAQFEKIQNNLVVNGWKKQTVGCFTEWFLFSGTTVSATKTAKQ